VPADVIDDMIDQPVLVLRLAAAAATLGTAAEKLDEDIAESLSSVLADAASLTDLVDGVLALVTRATGLEAAYLTSIDWTSKTQTVVGGHGPCRLDVGATFAWTGATPDPYGDARHLRGHNTYISAPVLDGSGGLVGTLCAISAGSVPLNRSQLAALEVLAGLLGGELSQQWASEQVHAAT
jgi:diguanylate cyclase